MAGGISTADLVAFVNSLLELITEVVQPLRALSSDDVNQFDAFQSLTTRLPLLTVLLEKLKHQTIISDDVALALQTVVQTLFEQLVIVKDYLNSSENSTAVSDNNGRTNSSQPLALRQNVTLAVDKINKNIEYLVLHQTTQNIDSSDRFSQELSRLQLAFAALPTLGIGHQYTGITADGNSSVIFGNVYYSGSSQSRQPLLDQVKVLGHPAPTYVPDSSNSIEHSSELEAVRGEIQKLQNFVTELPQKMLSNNHRREKGKSRRRREYEALRGSSHGIHAVQDMMDTISLDNMPLVQNSQHIQYRPKDIWYKASGVSKTKVIVRNSFIGTVILRTVTHSYRRTRTAVFENLEKQMRRTIATVLPARWLSSKGIVLRCETWNFDTAGVQQSPAWNLSTINIIPDRSEIWLAIQLLDLAAIQTMFRDRTASPFDVKEDGSNLLANVAAAVTFTDTQLEHLALRGLSIMQAIGEVVKLVDMLLEFGVDPGSLDINGHNAVSNLSECWFAGNPGDRHKFDGHLRLLLSKFVDKAESDLFECEEIGLILWKDGRIYASGIPSPQTGSILSIVAIDVLMNQTHGPITWSSNQLDFLCSLDMGLSSAESQLEFWIASTWQQVEVLLRIKTRLLVMFFTAESKRLYGKTKKQGQEQDGDLVSMRSTVIMCSMMNRGAEIIALLTKHPPDDYGLPWLCDRSRKWSLVSNFMLTTMHRILIFYGPYLTNDRWWLEVIARFTQRYDLQIERNWQNALQAVVAYPTAKASDDFLSTTTPEVGPSGTRLAKDELKGEDSEEDATCWETEDEWEEGYKPEAAIDKDRSSHANMQRKSSVHRTRATNRDYDAAYWSQAYPRFGEDFDIFNNLPAKEAVSKDVTQATDAYVQFFAGA